MNSEPNTLITESVAVVGGGYWGKNLVRNFSALKSLAAVCDTDESTLRALQAQYPGCRTFSSFSDVLCDDSVRAVAISSPAETHAALVREALLAEKDVFVEKPLCLSVDQGNQLVELARRSGRILMIGHLLWYHPAIVRLKELVQAGESRDAFSTSIRIDSIWARSGARKIYCGPSPRMIFRSF